MLGESSTHPSDPQGEFSPVACRDELSGLVLGVGPAASAVKGALLAADIFPLPDDLARPIELRAFRVAGPAWGRIGSPMVLAVDEHVDAILKAKDATTKDELRASVVRLANQWAVDTGGHFVNCNRGELRTDQGSKRAAAEFGQAKEFWALVSRECRSSPCSARSFWIISSRSASIPGVPVRRSKSWAISFNRQMRFRELLRPHVMALMRAGERAWRSGIRSQESNRHRDGRRPNAHYPRHWVAKIIAKCEISVNYFSCRSQPTTARWASHRRVGHVVRQADERGLDSRGDSFPNNEVGRAPETGEARAAADQPDASRATSRAAVSGTAALTIATMPARTADGSDGHFSATAKRSGSEGWIC